MSTLTGLISAGGSFNPTSSASGISFGKDGFVVTSSQTLVMPAAATITAICVGGGGGGAAASRSTSFCATGGGAGGYSEKTFNVALNESLTIVIGAGGASVTQSGSGKLDGNNGGNTTLTNGDSSITLTANGGSGGVGALSAGALSGGAGGTASGGDANYTGGAGGSISSTTSTGATGGGAVNSQGTNDCDGGDISTGDTTTNIATGGGSPFNRAGDVTANPVVVRSTGGGGFASPTDDSLSGSLGIDVSLDVPFAKVFNSEFSIDSSGNDSLAFGSGGTAGNGSGSPLAATALGGAGGVRSTLGTVVGTLTAGMFGGGGGMTSSSQRALGGAGGLGGGGGAAINTNASDFATSGAGGNGIVFIFIEEIL